MKKPTRLIVMSIRVAPQQAAALDRLRDENGISVQEHVRRAIELYLNQERRRGAGKKGD